MQEKNDGVIQSQGLDRRLSFGSVRVHNDHLSIGQKVGSGCRVCTAGLGGFMAEIAPPEEPDKKDEVVESDGGDKDRDSSPPPSDWPYSSG